MSKQCEINKATAKEICIQIADACVESMKVGTSEPIHAFLEDFQIYFITEDLPIGTMAFKGALVMDHSRQIMIDVYNAVVWVGTGDDRVCRSYVAFYDEIFGVLRDYYEGDLDNMAASW